MILAAYLIGESYGFIVVFLNISFTLCLFVPLIVFHFHRKNIERYGLFSQLSIVIITSIKVYFMGGMLLTGTPVYVGFMAPIFALIFPNKKRAIIIFMLYVVGMILATLLNPYAPKDHLFAGYLVGFIIGVTFTFLTVYYFTTQFEKSRKSELLKIKELDDLKTKFFTHIAHEFRTPLTIIKGIASQIVKDPDRWLQEGYDIIDRNTSDLEKLSNKILKLSKLEAHAMPLHLIQDDITIYIHYIVESFQSLSRVKNINLEFLNEDKEILMDFDPDKIHDIMSNLLSNAIKFTPNNGKIIVLLSVTKICDKDYFILKIKDNGIGIPSEQIDTIFNRYYQAENHLEALQEGAGLGLALTKEFVCLHDGNISVESSLNKGSTFTIEIPITNTSKLTQIDFQYSSNKKNKHTQHEHSSYKEDALNLLIIDDNPDIVNYLEYLLSNSYSVFIALDGKDGFKKALQIIPDLIISDVMMPEIDGISLCKRLKEDIRTSHIPIILLTALAEQHYKLDGLEVGADAYLTKPFDTDELFIRIEKLIALRKSLQQHYCNIIKHETSIVRTDRQSKEDTFIDKVRYVLETHLADEDFGINQLCTVMGMSRSQLYRKFSSLTDISVHQYILNLKLQKAKKLLTSTHLNVSEVAYDTGFKNISHFSRVFTKHFGYNPSHLKVEN